MAQRITISAAALAVGLGLISFTVAPALADGAVGVAPGNEAGAKAADSSSGGGGTGGPSKEAQEAQKKLANEDPTKIIKKADKDGDVKPSDDPAVEMQANGMWLDKDGNPTPHIAKDGKMDWFTFSGYRRYGANCLQCHGPDALGSSYAPSLVDALKTLSYGDFLQTVAAGKKDVNNSSNLVMPAFGENKNVQCYINDIYVYLRARAMGELGRDRPSKHEEKEPIYTTAETACLGF